MALPCAVGCPGEKQPAVRLVCWLSDCLGGYLCVCVLVFGVYSVAVTVLATTHPYSLIELILVIDWYAGGPFCNE